MHMRAGVFRLYRLLDVGMTRQYLVNASRTTTAAGAYQKGVWLSSDEQKAYLYKSWCEWLLGESCCSKPTGSESRGTILLSFIITGFAALSLLFGPLPQVISDIQSSNCYQPSARFSAPLFLDVYPHYIPPLTRCSLRDGSPLRGLIGNHVPLSGDSPELDSHPAVLVLLDFAQQRLPEVSVLDRDSIALHPAITDPIPSPVGGTFDGVLGIGGNHQCVEPLAGPVPETQGGNDSAQLRSVAGLKSIIAERSLLLQAARGEL